MNIWEFSAAIMRRLLAWAGFSLATGAAMLAQPNRFWRGVGAQFAGWALVNAAIAVFGGRATAQRQASLPDPLSTQAQASQRRSLSRLLWINTGLDVVYVLGGLALADSAAPENRLRRGTGAGIQAQGAFLFFFDLVHALLLGRK
jgi:hypothetical protein